jgi:hypothetical protein
LLERAFKGYTEKEELLNLIGEDKKNQLLPIINRYVEKEVNIFSKHKLLNFKLKLVL